jgi:serine/threonine protein kinase
MTPERWKQIEEIFRSALDREPIERDVFLNGACGEDTDLLAEVRSLLEADADTRSFLDTPPSGLLADTISASRNESLLGKHVHNFKIIKEIGEGALGQVYLAQDMILGRQAALKFLSTEFTFDENILHRFEQEAITASSLSHHNIVTIYGLEQMDGNHYIVMEYVDGETLRQHLAALVLEPYPLRLKEALSIAIQVAEALTYAHTKRIVHRDIKPENIMLPSDGRPIKVLDFGIAKVTTEITQNQIEQDQKHYGEKVETIPGTLLGTVNYMSPEQARALRTVDAQTDIWSLGVVFYEMITGCLPFEGVTTWDTLVSIGSKEPPPLTDSIREAPNDLQRIVSKALAKEKSERYQTARDLQHDLKKLWQEFGLEGEVERVIKQSLEGGAPVEGTHKSVLWLPDLISKGEKYISIPDLLTPGLPPKMLVDVLTPYVGSQLAERLEQLSEHSIAAVEDGDFDLHVSLGKQIETDSQGFPEIEAAGRYFAAEGYRLQADLESDQTKKQLLLKKAAEQYELSLEKNPNNARAIRGLARVYEVQGDYAKALNKFQQAEGVALVQLSSDEQTNLHLHLSHEILRITRHYIHCILDIIATNPQSIWHKEYKKRELEGYVMRSENLHRENMPLFKDREQWSRIEWFMGLVFFGKAWGRLGNIPRKTKCLVDALGVRRRMISDTRPLTNVELANIKWWINVALSEPRDMSLAGVEDLALTLDRGSTAEVLHKIDDILFPFVSLWQQGSL